MPIIPWAGTETVLIRQSKSYAATPIKSILLRNRIPNEQSMSSALNAFSTKGIELSGLLYDSCATASSAWDWTANLGAPAALVAGAVLVTLSETRENMIPRKDEKKVIQRLKQCCRILLLSSFALNVMCIFVGTVTGSVLLGHGEQITKAAMVGYNSPLALLRHHHEFEYLTIQISFLQGLLNWLTAVAIDLVITKDGETKSSRMMNKCLASWIVSLMLWITAFYNNHLNFYSDYASMLRRYFVLFMQKYVTYWPLRPMSFLYVPSLIASGVFTWLAFSTSPDKDED